MELTIRGHIIVNGIANGIALVTNQPLSFWGGYDFMSGEITDRRHPLSGENASGRILALPFSRGSSTTTAVLLESVNAGTAPAAIITTSIDPFFALASIVAEEMYAIHFPVIKISPRDFSRLKSGDSVRIEENGVLLVQQTNDD